MECGETHDLATQTEPSAALQPSNISPEAALPSPQQSPEISAEEKREEKVKRTKVHKREQELFGLVTPIFLPLLDASDISKDREKKKRHKKKEGADASPPKRADLGSSGDAGLKQERQDSSSKSSGEMEIESVTSPEPMDSQKENHSDSSKKPKRPVIKKSSLRNSSEKRRRKRVSLVIDGQTVLPADQIAEPQLMSPSETTSSSASNSTASLEDTLDPRLRGPESAPYQSHNDPVHHSLNLPSHLPSASPTKHTGHTLPTSPDQSPMYDSPPSSHTHLEYEPPQSTTRTYLDPSPTADSTQIPRYASTTPIYADAPELAEEPEEEFSTYVGGLQGSGIDDMDQTGSLGYPSSVGASYMESYMASRPLSVRMAAAEKAGLSDAERRRLLNAGNARAASEEAEEADPRHAHGKRDDDDMEIVGSMDDF